MQKTSFSIDLPGRILSLLMILLLILLHIDAGSQPSSIKWAGDGNGYYKLIQNQILRYSLPDNKSTVIISEKQLTPPQGKDPLQPVYFNINENLGKALIMTNAKKVWRLNTRGDFWILDTRNGNLHQLGTGLPASTLMFAKLSPDGKYAAYVSGNNIYSEDLSSFTVKALTHDGSATLINGTFDWAYEEEFYCRDGFRWSNDSKSIAYWQIDAGSIKKFNMINNTDSIYPKIIPIEYPVAGENPSSARIGVVTINDAKTTWINIPGDPAQHYLVRMEFVPSSGNLLIQQLNRKQDTSRLFLSDPGSGESKIIQEESDEAWVDLEEKNNAYNIDYTNNFEWINGGRDILWTSEKDGWRHIYQISLVENKEKLLTNGPYDVISFEYFDSKSGFLYFMASPENATRKYLYRTSLKNPEKLKLISPETLQGTHEYIISPGGKYAYHSFSNYFTRQANEFISMADQKPLNPKESIVSKQDSLKVSSTTEFFKITIPGNIEIDGWMSKPKDFDPSKKYPVLFYVYSEPAGATVQDVYGIERNFLYSGNLAKDGYIYISVDNRGTPAPKGRAWRKSIYGQIGQINISDQAMAAREILNRWSFLDPGRVAVWGWSGGGSATLNLLFQHPEIYTTGIAIAAEAYMFTYDNIYQERYMGLPQENREAYIKGSPVTYAGNLKGNLLYIHGTGDDNVHYQNAEILVNELIKHNKIFQFMPYPNRTHSISEGEGTPDHLINLFSDYLRKNCPPGAK